MSTVHLFTHQENALNKMRNGCILNGGVGSGKSITSIAYYYILNGGKINTKNYVEMINPCDLYIITTARKRDENDWEKELVHFHLSTDPAHNHYKNRVIVDSWNNIKKYINVSNAFFIFDEQRVVGYGTWTKSFLKITEKNKWILLSATPGDTWMDYIPVFVANGFYKNKSDFCRRHVVFSRYTKYPKVERYINQKHLEALRNYILIPMEFERQTISHNETILVSYDIDEYHTIQKDRWNIYKNTPIRNAGEYCLCLRKSVNSHNSRRIALMSLIEKHPKAIIFYSYDYELEILRELFKDYPMAEWNGHKHEPIPQSDNWVYLVEYLAGCEGWNCTTTDTIIFFSLHYSYKVIQQAKGRIDRLDTPYTDLYYYTIRSNAPIDLAIESSITRKKKFNEKKFAPFFSQREELKLTDYISEIQSDEFIFKGDY